MKKTTLIFPDQLFNHHPGIKETNHITLVEHPHFFSDFRYHKQKLMLHRASMKGYAAQSNLSITYIDHKDCASTKGLINSLKKQGISEIHITEITNQELARKLQEAATEANITLIEHPTPMFLTPKAELIGMIKKQPKPFMAPFYVEQRKRLNILIESNGKPTEGKWSFDTDNRKKLASSQAPEDTRSPNQHALVKEARDYIEKHFAHNPGKTHSFSYPVTRRQALHELRTFIEQQLPHFGDYQDAIVEGKTFLYHSILSAPINIGLLSPQEVIDYALTSSTNIPLNALEGFIRQIIGWREFVYGVYLVHGKKQKQSNFFRHKNNLPNAFWNASTQLDPVDDTLKRIDEHCYAHHIERLMVLGNILLLLEVHPKQVYSWFMEQFIDSYEWVMIPNVFGMSQYADGGLMVTKPYISSSNYIKKMSDYKKGEWEPLWTALYWRFMIKHKTKLQDIPRMFRQMQLLQRLNPETKQAHVKRAETYLRTLKKSL